MATMKMPCAVGSGGYSELEFNDVQISTGTPYTFTKAYKRVIIVTTSGSDRTSNILLNGTASTETYYSSHSSQSNMYMSSVVFDDVKVGDEIDFNTGSSWAITMYCFN